MADDIARLGLVVDADGFVRADKAMADFSRTAVTAEQRANQLNKEVDNMAKFAQRATQAFGVLAASFGVREIIQYADAWRSVSNQVRLVTDSEEQFTRVRQGVVAAAKNSNSELGATAALYSTLARYSGDLVKGDSELLRITETLNKSFAVSGASAESQAGAIRQLSQALASGALRGDEFNSVNENAPRIMDAIAASLNMTKGELRAFAAEGNITSKIIIDAVRGMAGEIDSDFDKMEKTFAMYVQNAKTNATEFLGSSSEVQSATKVAGEAILAMSEHMDVLMKVAEGAALVMGARLVAGLGKATIATIANISTTATATTTTNIWGQRVITATAAQNLMAASVGRLNSIMAIFGGPAGLTLAAVGALVMLVSGMEDAAERAARLRDEIDALTESQIRNNMAIAESEAVAIRAAIARAEVTRDRSAADERAYQIQVGRLNEVNKRLRDYQSALNAIKETQFQKWIDDMTEGYVMSTAAANDSITSISSLANAQSNHTDKIEDNVLVLKMQLLELGKTDRQLAVHEALIRASTRATGENLDEELRLINAYYDQQDALKAAADAETDRAKAAEDAFRKMEHESEQAAQAMIDDWQKVRQSFGEFFADLVIDGSNAFDALLKSWERTALQMAGNKLFDLGASMLGAQIPGGASATSYGAFGTVLSAGGAKLLDGILGRQTITARQAAAINLPDSAAGFNLADLKNLGYSIGAGIAGGYVGDELGQALFGKQAESNLGATAGGAIGTYLGGPLGSFIGSTIGSMVDAAFGGDGKQRQNQGFLVGDTPGANPAYLGEQYTFASGITVQAMTRRGNNAATQQIIDTFQQVDQSFVDLVTALGGSVSSTWARGLDEEATPGSAGNFFGLGGNGQLAGDVVAQVNSWVDQLADHVTGLDDSLLDAIRSAGTAEDALALLTKAVADQAAEAENAAAKQAKLTQATESFGRIADYTRDYIADLVEQQSRFLESQKSAVEDYYHDLYDSQYKLYQTLKSYMASLRTGDLSILSPREQLDAAKSEFQNLASVALNTSLGMDQRLKAAQGLQGAADTYLKEGQGYYASSAGYKDIFNEVMQTLEAAKFLGTNQPFEGSALENQMLAELQKLNDQMGLLPDKMAAALGPLMNTLIAQAILSGKSGTYVANTISSLGDAAKEAANDQFESAYGKTIDEAATTAQQAQDALTEIKALGLSEVDTIKLIAQKAQEQGLSAAQVGNLLGLSQDQINKNLALAGIPSFDVGTNYVPYDMTANIHRGEAIIPAADNAFLMQNSQDVADKLDRLIVATEKVVQAVVRLGGMEEVLMSRQTEDMTDAINDLRSALNPRSRVGTDGYGKAA